jgi:N utilization substance protein B
MGRRSKARECAFQMLYQWEISREPIESVALAFWRVRSGTDAMRSMADRLARGASGDVERLDAAIRAATEHWRFERIAPVDRALLRLGAFELIHEPTPAPVVIDEAIELARRFGEADSPAFVNGVLDAVMRAERGRPEEKRDRRA